jgi:hypothetical protein
MRYIEQEHSEGCMIAAIAMVLDMTYEEAAESIPLPDRSAFLATGENLLQLRAYDELKTLAEKRG